MDNFLSSLRNKLKSLRHEHNITQAELARLLSVSQVTVARWENGERALTLNALANIAVALKIDILEFFTPIKLEESIELKERQLLNVYKQLSQEGRERLIEYAELLLLKYPTGSLSKVG